MRPSPEQPATERAPAHTRIPLLSQMQRDLRDHGALRAPTVAAMYLAYGGHAAVTAAALRGRWLPLRVPRGCARLTGVPLAAAGAGLCVLGMRRFSGAGQVSGTRQGPLVTRGVYRYSRNPQYLGYVLLLAGLATARRSAAGLATAGLAAGTFAAWVPVEEGHLERSLGAPYLRYRVTTGRWWGRSRPGEA